MEKLAESVHDAVQDVQDWLEQVKRLDELITAKLAERSQLMDMATRMTPEMSDMPHGTGVSDRVGDVVVKLVSLAKETDELVDKYVDKKAAVVAALEKLPPMEYAVLHRHYIRYMTLGEIAEDMDYCYMQIWRYKEKGLKSLQDVIASYTIPVV